MSTENSFGTRASLSVGDTTVAFHSLETLERGGFPAVARLPYSLKILLENLLRFEDDNTVKAADILALGGWATNPPPAEEIAYRPARVLMQDFTGVPAVVDLAAMRDAMKTK